MNGYVCVEQDIVQDSDESKFSGSGNLPASAGTFALRRRHYLNETRIFLELLLGHAGGVISFEIASHEHPREFDNSLHQHRRT